MLNQVGRNGEKELSQLSQLSQMGVFLQFVFVCCLIFSQLILVLLFCRYNRLIFCLPREQGFPRQKTIVSQAGNKCFPVRE